MRVGVDLGGTKIAAVALDETGALRAERRIATPAGDYAGCLAAIAGLVADLETETGTAARVGIGMPGAISPATGLVKNANSTWLNGQPFAADIEAALRRPVRLANDADCFAVSEATDGAAAGRHSVFGVILGTGVGGGLVIGGRPLRGPNAIAGEWGHNPLPWMDAGEHPGPRCWCGRDGCIETFLSGPGLAADYVRAGGDCLTPEAVVHRAAEGEGLAEQSLARYERRLARALAHVINLVDPDAIVLGGGLSRLRRLYDSVPALWGEWVFSDRVDTPLLPPAHGDASGVRGAAWLWDADAAETR